MSQCLDWVVYYKALNWSPFGDGDSVNSHIQCVDEATTFHTVPRKTNKILWQRTPSQELSAGSIGLQCSVCLVCHGAFTANELPSEPQPDVAYSVSRSQKELEVTCLARGPWGPTPGFRWLQDPWCHAPSGSNTPSR